MRKVIENNKKIIGLYLINVLALMPLLCFAFQHFSVDTYLLASENGIDVHINAFIGSFRYVGALIHKVWNLLGQAPISNPLLDIAIFVLVVALVTTKLSNFIYIQLKQKSTLSYIIVNLSVLVSVTNVWFVNILTFPECIFATAIGVLLCFFAIIVYFSKQNIPGKIISALLLICSTAIYQQFLVVFIIYAILLCSIKLKNSDNSKTKDTVFEYLKLILLILVSGIIYYGIGIGVQKLFSVAANERVALSLDSMLNNLIYFITKQHSYLKGRGFFDTEILTLCYVIVGTIWVVAFICHIKKNKLNFKSVCLFLSYIVAYGSSFLMGIVSISRVARTMFGLFTVFALFTIGTILLINRRFVKYILASVLFIVFALNMYANIEMSLELREINTQEIMLAEQYLYEIEEYEKSENVVVNNIEFCTDVNPKISDNSSLRFDYSFSGLMGYISGRDFIVTQVENTEMKSNFVEKDWDGFIADEQLIFENDTLYVCIY